MIGGATVNDPIVLDSGSNFFVERQVLAFLLGVALRPA